MMFFYHFGNIVHKTGETDNIAGDKAFQIAPPPPPPPPPPFLVTKL